MAILATQTVDRITAVYLNHVGGHLVGRIVDTGAGYFLADVAPAVPIVVDSHAAALGVFGRLTRIPAGEQCEAGDVRAAQAILAVDIPPASTLVQLQIASYAQPDTLNVSLGLLLDVVEAGQLLDALSFALARIAVTS